jgi:archaellum biogenesis ATPase FlaH
MAKHKENQYKWKNLPRFDPSKAPKTKWLWKNLIPERSITFVVGDAGSYKSTFLLALCKAISRGERFLGRPTKRRRVLYLDNENPLGVLAERDKEMNLELKTNKRFVLWSIYDGVPVPRIDSDALPEIVRKSVAEGYKLLIVLDHWTTFLKPGDGGETTGQTTPIMQELRRLCALGATILVTCHTVKYDNATFYGGADIRDKLDAMHTFVLERESGHEIIHVDSFLKRHGGRRSFSIEPIVEKKHGKTHVTGFRLVKDRKHQRRIQIEKIRGLIRKNPNASQRGLAIFVAKALGIGRNKAERLLNKYTGKFWKTHDGPNRKKTYILLKPEENS